MAAAKWTSHALVMAIDQVVNCRPIHLIEPELGSEHGDHLPEHLLGRVGGLDLVGYAPEKRLIDELAGLEIGRENDELIKRDPDLFAAGQAEEVVPLLEGHDPAIQ